MGMTELGAEKILPVAFYERDPPRVANSLLGKKLVRIVNGHRVIGRITETEAYGGAEDLASHAHSGNKGRASIMYQRPGLAYIYFIYGMYYCLNAVAHSKDQEAGAVLIRSIELLDGIQGVEEQMGKDRRYSIARGPGNLSKALYIDKRLNGADLTVAGEIFIIEGELKENEVVSTSSRVGIKKEIGRKWRFYLAGNKSVSGPAFVRAQQSTI